MARKGSADNLKIQNKKARFNYEIIEKLECGVALKGSEIKSLRNRQVSLEEAFVRIQGDELWLIGCNIKPYANASVQNHDPTRPRKLLAHKREIRKWLPKVTTRGLTLVPLNIHFNQRGLAKVTVALVRGKTHGDKRQALKKRDHQREMDRAVRR